MKIADIWHTLVRRWYLTVPLLIVTAAMAAGAFVVVSPTWQRSATIVLLPDRTSVPAGGNPYLFLSGLGNVADVLTRASASQGFLDGVSHRAPGTQVEITRDATTTSPVITVTVTSPTDAAANHVLGETITHVDSTLDGLQADEGLAPARRITAATLSIDVKGTAVQRTRMLAVSAAAVAGLVLVVIVPTAVEGLRAQRRRRG